MFREVSGELKGVPGVFNGLQRLRSLRGAPASIKKFHAVLGVSEDPRVIPGVFHENSRASHCATRDPRGVPRGLMGFQEL